MEAECKGNLGGGNEYIGGYLDGKEENLGLQLLVDATNRCQLKCGYCYYGDKGNQLMNVERVFRACVNVTQIFSDRLRKVCIHYMGGEPLLAWKRILELSEKFGPYLKEQGIEFEWGLTSNLVGRDEIKAQRMIKERASIHCSLDGPEEIQNRNRPFKSGQGSFAAVAKAIPLALQITPGDAARVTVRPADAKRMPEIAQDVFGRGFKTVGLFPAEGENWDREAVDDWRKGLEESLRLADGAKGKRSILTLLTPYSFQSKKRQRFHFCGAGRGLWGIGVDGDLFFCHHMSNNKKLAIINAAEASVEEIKAAIRSSSLPPKTSAIPEACFKCSAFDFCDGGCWANNMLLGGQTEVPFPGHCAIKRATVETLGDRLRSAAALLQAPAHEQGGFYSMCWLSCEGGYCPCDGAGCESCVHSQW